MSAAIDPDFNANQAVKVVEDRAAQAAIRFLATIEAKQPEQLREVWTENGVFELPFAVSAVPDEHHPRFVDQTAIIGLFTGVRDMKEFAFREFAVYPMRDPAWAFIEFKADIWLCDSDEHYTESYCALARAEGDRLALFREFFHSHYRAKFEGDKL